MRHASKGPAVAVNLGALSDLVAADARAAEARIAGLGAALRAFVEWAEEHRAEAKRLGERPCIDAHRINRAKAALKRAGI